MVARVRRGRRRPDGRACPVRPGRLSCPDEDRNSHSSPPRRQGAGVAVLPDAAARPGDHPGHRRASTGRARCWCACPTRRGSRPSAAVLGFDWHSSGVTTTVCGALKDGLRGLEHESGLIVAGGKGGVSRKTPAEIEAAAAAGTLAAEPARACLRQQDGGEGRQRRAAGRLPDLSPQLLLHPRR